MCSSRYSYYLQDITGADSIEELKEEVYKKMNEGAIFDLELTTVEFIINGGAPTEEVNRTCCDIITEYIYNRMN